MHDPRLDAILARQPHPLIFVTVSGAHLYGFPSPDSDYDLRGVHVLPAREVLGLFPPHETIECSTDEGGLEIDLVTHDLKKFMTLMLRRNGYVLEQLLSPIVLRSSPEHEELKELSRGCLTKHHAHHYLGFAQTQWRLFEKDPRAKPLLYVYRVLLTGIHLMRTGSIEANLLRLNDVFRLPYIPELVQRKLTGSEKGELPDPDRAFHHREYARLTGELEEAMKTTELPDASSSGPALSDLLVRVRTTR